jgi:hypothetical protein
MVIFWVQLQVLVEVVDAFREKRDLNLWGAGVSIMQRVFFDDVLFFHFSSPFFL